VSILKWAVLWLRQAAAPPVAWTASARIASGGRAVAPDPVGAGAAGAAAVGAGAVAVGAGVALGAGVVAAAVAGAGGGDDAQATSPNVAATEARRRELIVPSML
jgi:hypothetical protein